jgi:hypothetical protein
MEGKTFEEALGDLLAEYRGEGNDALISALELRAMALKEDQGPAEEKASDPAGSI